MTRSDFNNLVHTISRLLYVHAYRILKDRESSEDAVQEVFVKLWKMNPKIDEYESINALAVTMVKNHCIDQVRKRKHIGSADSNAFNHYRDPDPSPHDNLESSETYLIMERIINELPEIYREIIQQKDIDGLSYEEIAGQTGQNINTLRVNLSRARKMVRDIYKRNFNGSEGSKTTA